MSTQEMTVPAVSMLTAEEGERLPANWQIAEDYDPNDHLMNLKGRDYLNVQNRLLWFIKDQRAFIRLGLARVPYVIRTELVELDREAGFAHFKTYIRDVFGNESTAYGSETARDFGDYPEKGGTKSEGRALLGLGYGTAFAPEMDEGERVVDSPVERETRAAPRTTAKAAPVARPAAPAAAAPTSPAVPTPPAAPTAPAAPATPPAPPATPPTPPRRMAPPVRGTAPKATVAPQIDEDIKTLVAEDQEGFDWVIAHKFTGYEQGMFLAKASAEDKMTLVEHWGEYVDDYLAAMAEADARAAAEEAAEEAAPAANVPATEERKTEWTNKLATFKAKIPGDSKSEQYADTIKGLCALIMQTTGKRWSSKPGQSIIDVYTDAELAQAIAVLDGYDITKSAAENGVKPKAA